MAHSRLLVLLDVAEKRLHRAAKVARLWQAGVVRHELTDVHIVWANELGLPCQALSGVVTLKV